MNINKEGMTLGQGTPSCFTNYISILYFSAFL